LTATEMQIFFTVRSGISAPQIRDYDVLLGWLVFMFVVWFLQLDITYITEEPITVG